MTPLRAALLGALGLAATCLAQEAPSQVSVRPSIGPAREVQVTALQPQGQGVRLVLSSGAPEGAVLAGALIEEELEPPVSRNHAAVRAGEVMLVLRFPERAAPGLYEALVVHDPAAQPRWVTARGLPGRRVLPVVLGTLDDAQAARDQAATAAAQGVDALIAAASEVTQAFGPRAPRWTRASLQDWLRERALPRAGALEDALSRLRPTRTLAAEDRELRAQGRRVLDALAGRAKQACFEQELPLPGRFADAATGDAGDVERLLVDALALRAHARRGALAPEPSPLTLDRLVRRLARLTRVEGAADDVARPEVLRYVLEDVTRSLARVRPALAALAAEVPAAAELATRLAEDAAAAGRVAPERAPVAAAKALWTRLGQLAFQTHDLVRRRHLLEDRAELLALKERLAEAGGDAATAAAWRRRLGVAQQLVATSKARDLAAWLVQAGDLVARKRPLPADAEARWAQALAAVDAALR